MKQVELSKKERKEFKILVGKRIVSLREEKGLSSSDLAKLCSMDAPNLTRLEKGRVNTSVTQIKIICLALDISMDMFFKGL